MASYDLSQWVKDARAWTSATKGNQAVEAFQKAGQPAAVTDIARQISNLYEGMRYGAEDNVDDYDRNTAAARQAMLDQFAQTEGNTQAAYANSQNYTSEIAKRLGLEGVLQGPGVESQRQQMNQVMALNNANKTNQTASYDLLRGGYGRIMRDRLGSFDVQAGTTLANLLTQLQAQQAAAAAASRGGGGGGGGGGSSDKLKQQIVPSNATYDTLFLPVSNKNFPSGAMKAKEGGISSGKPTKYVVTPQAKSKHGRTPISLASQRKLAARKAQKG